MEFDQRIAFTIFLVTFLGFFLSASQSYTFYVGGRDGWVLKPKEDYNQWAGRNRFQINDTLIFRYKKGYDDVLEVDKDDYYNCNKENPFLALKDGESVFKFNRSGPFFFISGHADNCQKGQRLIIVVLHPRGNPTDAPSPVAANPPSPSPSPSPAPIFAPTPSPIKPNTPPPAAASPPSPVIVQPFAPAPSPSAASIAFGGLIGSLLGISFFLVIFAFGY
ncbi:early nodulin-like protein 3 [Coffea arabica]|uniref:Early nodulin-like protein 3 n=1 Tax=Coffea arabica TaxID=13443 RepID=A0A6P6S455_COFAR